MNHKEKLQSFKNVHRKPENGLSVSQQLSTQLIQSTTFFSLDQRRYFEGGKSKLGAHKNISGVLNNVVVVLSVVHLYSVLWFCQGPFRPS